MIWGVVAAVIVLGGAGVVIWMTRRRGTHELFEVPGVEGDLSFICSTSALADTSKDTLFVCGEETVHRVNMMRREAIGSFPLPPGAGKLLDCVVTGDKLLLALFTDAGRGLLVGLNTESGEERWRLGLDGVSGKRLVFPLEGGDRRTILVYGDDGVALVDLKEGRPQLRWRVQQQLDLNLWSMITVRDGWLYLTHLDLELARLRFSLRDGFMEQLGGLHEAGFDPSVEMVEDERDHLPDNYFFSGDSKTDLGKYINMASWFQHDGGVFVHLVDGLLSLDPVTGAERWRANLKGVSVAAQKLNGRIYFTTASRYQSIQAVDLHTGKVVMNCPVEPQKHGRLGAWRFAVGYSNVYVITEKGGRRRLMATGKV